MKTILYTSTHRPMQIFVCGLCERVHNIERLADACCAPNTCRECKSQTPQPYVICQGCRDIAHARVMEEKKNKAEDVSDSYTGPVYDPATCAYYADVDALLESEDEPPSWVWACTVSHPRLDLDAALEAEEENLEMDPEFSPEWAGLRELAAAVETFNREQSQEIWHEDTSRIVFVDGSTE